VFFEVALFSTVGYFPDFLKGIFRRCAGATPVAVEVTKTKQKKS